ncbi:MAG: hypothetical protein JW959_04285 [Pirellulales bacterium]|nr:hypothetical protein [Pirellulales bacterium]
MDTIVDALIGNSAPVNVALAVAGAAALWIVWRSLRRRRGIEAPLRLDLNVEVAALEDRGPPQGPPVLEFYNLPVRLAAVVLAPVGVNRELPSEDRLAPLLESVVPGLDKVAESHRPLVRRWPNQVSARGFAHLFFKHAKLPGLAGKGTVWSSVAGVVKVAGEPVMAGLVLRAAVPNSIGQTIVDAEHQWLGCLRVKWV